MEFTKTEVQVIEEAAGEASNEQLRELNDLQLAFIGGGSGEVVFA